MEKIKIVLSLGAGVQSSALALMAAKGEIGPMPDIALFADTGYEPAQVYRWLDWLEKQLPFPIKRVTRGNLYHDELAGNKNRVPYFVKNERGEIGLGKRQCTADYKIKPIEQYVR